jgi:clorobiocin biosynthesis protein CloN6
MDRFLDLVGKSSIRSVSYEQFHLTPEPILKRMVEANKRTSITLSPESHDIRISKLSGRGVYSNEQLEAWIEKALAIGIYNIDIWYFIGMPEQDRASVDQTVEYCHRLLRLFQRKRVNPMLCPMIPFLDPASTFFEHPQKNGYRVFFRTVEEHRRGMERASIINRINYETKWLRREDLVYTGFAAISNLMQAKAECGFMRRPLVATYNGKIADALSMIKVVHAADCIANPKERTLELEKLGGEIERRNRTIFHSGVSNQAFPVNRQIGSRWFDEMGWQPATIESYAAARSAARVSKRPTGWGRDAVTPPGRS